MEIAIEKLKEGDIFVKSSNRYKVEQVNKETVECRHVVCNYLCSYYHGVLVDKVEVKK